MTGTATACEVCGTANPEGRSDRRYCSNACRKRAMRARGTASTSGTATEQPAGAIATPGTCAYAEKHVLRGRATTLDTTLITTIAEAVKHQGGDYDNVEDLIGVWERVARVNGERADRVRAEAQKMAASFEGPS